MNEKKYLTTSKAVKDTLAVFLLLLSLICIFDAGSFGFIFKFLFGKAYVAFFLITLFLSIYSLTKKKNLKIKKVTIIFLSIAYFFLMTLLSQKVSSNYFNGFFKNYLEAFKSIKSLNIIQLLFSNNNVGGGLIGEFGFAIFGSIFTAVPALIICYVFCIASTILALIPLFKLLKKIVANNKMRRKLKKADEEEAKLMNQEIVDSLIDNPIIDQEEAKDTLIDLPDPIEFDEHKDVLQDELFGVDIESLHEEKEPAEVRETVSERIKDINDFDVTTDDIFAKKVNVEKIDLVEKKDFDVLSDLLYFEKENKSEVEVSDTVEIYDNLHDIKVEPVQEEVEESLIEMPDTINQDYSENINQNSLYNNTEEEESVEETPATNYEDEIEQVDTYQQEEPVDEYDEQSYEENFDEPVIEKPVPEVKETQTEWRLPPLSLLNEPVFQDTTENEANAQLLAVRINNKFKSLNIKGEVVDYLVSPSFTRFRIKFAPEYRLNNFKSIELDLQSATESSSISLLAPIPGDQLSGIDIPNKVRTPVCFKECFVKIPFNAQNKKLICAMGKDCLGNVVTLDVTKTQHLLVAGATGSGKSGGLNSLLMSIIMRATPEEVRFLLIDRKLNEFKFYIDLPHLVCPVIFKPEEANEALKRVCNEIVARNELIRECDEAIDIESYNEYQRRNGGKIMPYFITAIDEFAFLIQDFKTEIEDSIKTITAVGRSVGVYIICCTQTPRKEVITGTIKANLPSTLAFFVKSPIDSQVVLGKGGAEKLLPPGDMYMDLSGCGDIIRAQGCFVTIEEKNRIIKYWKDQGKPEYYQDFIDLKPPVPDVVSLADAASIPEDRNDVLYNEILEWLANQEIVSISSIQRHFMIGQPRAGRMIDMLEKDGFISPSNGFKSRTVYRDRLPKGEDYRS